MSGYCTNCGAPLSSAFCGNCGQRAGVPTSPGVPSASSVPSGPSDPLQSSPTTGLTPVQSPPAPELTKAATKTSLLAKVLLIGVGIVLLLIVMSIAGALYGLHWVKGKIAAYSGTLVGSTEQVKVEEGHSCALLVPADLQQVLGVTIEKNMEIMEGPNPGCAYYATPEGLRQLRRMGVEQARKDSAHAAKRPGPKSDNPLELLKDTKQLEGIVKSFGLSQTQPNQEGKVFAFTVQRDFGRNNWPVIHATMSAIPGFEDVPGVGDRAMIGTFGHTFYVLKGDSMVRLDLTSVPDARMRGVKIGRKIVSHL